MKTVRIDLNRGMPDLTLKQAKKAMAKHTALGGSSPLTDFLDMVLFNVKIGNAETLRNNANMNVDLFQEKYGLASSTAGTAKGQNRDSINTIYFGVLQVKGILMVKHRGNEEALQGYGFNVVISQTGARRNVRVDIPYKNTPKMIELGQEIVAKHLALGVGSPLTGNIDMTAFAALVTAATNLMAEWEAARDAAQEQHNEALNIIGYGAGQTKDSVGTIYYDRISMRDRLLQVHQGKEESLSSFGFDVVIGESKKRKGGGVTIVVQIELPAGLHGIIDLSEVEGHGPSPTNVAFQSTGSDGNYYAAEAVNDPPGANAVLTVLNGQKLNRTPEQVSTQLGLGDDKPYLKVVNTGTAPGIFKVTFTFPS